MTTSATWSVRRVNPDTWVPGAPVARVESVSVTRSANDGTPLLESASMEMTGELVEGYYRVDMLSGGISTPICTMLFVPDEGRFSHGAWSTSATGYSTLLPASQMRFAPGEYAPKGVDGAQWCANLLRRSVKAPVTVDGGFKLANHVVFDLGESHLDGVWEVLDQAGWCIQVSGDGSIAIRELPKVESLVVDEGSALMPEIGRSVPLSDVPNVVMVYEGDDGAVAKNEDADSPTSIASRGREIQVVEENPTRREGETLANYARRRLDELSEVYETVSVSREYDGETLPYDMVRSNLPKSGIVGSLRVRRQEIACARGVLVDEEWGRLA